MAELNIGRLEGEGLMIEQASKSIGGILHKVRREGYAEGYLDGKKRLRTGLLETHETTQEARDRIVDRAKSDVANLNRDGVARIIVNKDKRTVVALIIWRRSGYLKSRGISKCAPVDCFNEHIGTAIALRRALNLEVPDEYIHAPHPIEVRVGNGVGFSNERAN